MNWLAVGLCTFNVLIITGGFASELIHRLRSGQGFRGGDVWVWLFLTPFDVAILALWFRILRIKLPAQWAPAMQATRPRFEIACAFALAAWIPLVVFVPPIVGGFPFGVGVVCWLVVSGAGLVGFVLGPRVKTHLAAGRSTANDLHGGMRQRNTHQS